MLCQKILNCPQGLHVKDIAVKNGMDASILGSSRSLRFGPVMCRFDIRTPSARILRLLATHHVFREVRPDVFTNNRLSSVVDTQKASAELFAKSVLSTSTRSECNSDNYFLTFQGRRRNSTVLTAS